MTTIIAEKNFAKAHLLPGDTIHFTYDHVIEIDGVMKRTPIAKHSHICTEAIAYDTMVVFSDDQMFGLKNPIGMVVGEK